MAPPQLNSRLGFFHPGLILIGSDLQETLSHVTHVLKSTDMNGDVTNKKLGFNLNNEDL